MITSDQQSQGDEERMRQEEQDKINAYADAMIRRDKGAWGGRPDNILVGGDIYTRTSSGYRNTVNSREPTDHWKAK
jgi:hypothetical protein